MGWEAWLTGALLVGMLAALVAGRWGPDIILMGVLVTLLLAGIIDAGEAVRGFSNGGVITVAMLYVVAAGMRETGAINLIAGPMLKKAKSVVSAQARMVLPVVGLSAFINNTPIVAMLMPAIDGFSKRSGIPASKLMLPLSYASIFGGVCTLIGTSTNVVVAGMMSHADVRDTLGDPVRLSMFTITWVGVPMAIVGIAYILLFSKWLLPDRSSPEQAGQEQSRKYLAAMRLTEGSPLAGKTVEGAGLRSLPGLFLSRIDRADSTVIAVGPEETLCAGDVLVFVGRLDSLVDLQQFKGLEPIADEEGGSGYRPNLRLVEAVVSPASPLVGSTVRSAGIRTRYGAVVVAVHRQGYRLRGKIGDIRLRPGDTLLLEAPQGFAKQYRDSTDFMLVSEAAQTAALRHERAWIAMGIVLAVVVAISTGWLDPMVAAMAGAGLMILTRCCTGPQARRSVDFQVLIVIAAAFGIERAMSKTGLASWIAHGVVDATADLGPWALLAVTFAVTTFFTCIITNNAAAVLMFPIALGITQEAGLNFLPFAVVIAVAASCEFSTPIGYQTNLMVMGPGGYKWIDYTRFGGPLTILCGIVCVALAPFVYGPLVAQ
ncbi:MAG: SLC13 family permease [Phycisphaeraceae bacterium]|nr:SLC13 family permease [Phycisphaeraceae bacterium]